MGDFGSHQSAPVNTSEPENNHPTSQYGGKFLMFHRSGQMCLVAAPWQVGRFSGGGGEEGEGCGGGRREGAVKSFTWVLDPLLESFLEPSHMERLAGHPH